MVPHYQNTQHKTGPEKSTSSGRKPEKKCFGFFFFWSFHDQQVVKIMGRFQPLLNWSKNLFKGSVHFHLDSKKLI
jgi:hypothetical protein